MVTNQHLEEFRSSQCHGDMTGWHHDTIKRHQQSKTRPESTVGEDKHTEINYSLWANCCKIREELKAKENEKNEPLLLQILQVQTPYSRYGSSSLDPLQSSLNGQHTEPSTLTQFVDSVPSENLPMDKRFTKTMCRKYLTDEEILEGVNKKIASFRKDHHSTGHESKERGCSSVSLASLKDYPILKDGAVECKNGKRTVHTTELPNLPCHTLSRREKGSRANIHTVGEEKLNVRNSKKVHSVQEWLNQNPSSNTIGQNIQKLQSQHGIIENKFSYSRTSLAIEITSKMSQHVLTRQEQQQPMCPQTSRKLKNAAESFPKQSSIVLKDSKYEEISDEDGKQLLKIPEFKESNFPVKFEDYGDENERTLSQLNFEDVTSDEARVLVSDNEQIPEKESSHTAHSCGCSYLVETENGFECPQCHNKKEMLSFSQSESLESEILDSQTSPLSFLEENDSDDLMNDYLVIPLDISDIRLESQTETELLLLQGEVGDAEKYLTNLSIPISHQSQCFDTAESCELVENEGLDNKAPITESLADLKTHSDSSYETEDSCTYSPSQKQNFLTASSLALTSGTLSASSNNFEEKYKNDLTNIQKKQLIQKPLYHYQKSDFSSDEDSETRTEATKVNCVDRGFTTNQKMSLPDCLPNCLQQLSRKKTLIEKSGLFCSVSNNTSYEDDVETSTKTSNLSVDMGTSGVQLRKTFKKMVEKNKRPRYQYNPYEKDMQPESSGLRDNGNTIQLHDSKSSNFALTMKYTTKAFKRKSKSGKSPKKKSISCPAKKNRKPSSDSADTEGSKDADSDALLSSSELCVDENVGNEKRARPEHVEQKDRTLLKKGRELTKAMPKACIKKAKPLNYISSNNETEDSEDFLSDTSDHMPKVQKKEKGKSENSGAVKAVKCGFEANTKKPSSIQHVEQLLPSKSKYLDPPTTLSALDKVKDSWRGDYVPIKMRRRPSLGRDDMAPKITPAKEPILGSSHLASATRKRHNLQRSETPLMKKTKFEAKERTREINCHLTTHQSNAVAHHYKWKETAEKAVSRRRKRCPSPSLLEESD